MIAEKREEQMPIDEIFKPIDEIFKTMYGAKVWSSLGFKSAFWQIPIRGKQKKQQLFVKRDCSTLT